jgi:hypothetical protein
MFTNSFKDTSQQQNKLFSNKHHSRSQSSSSSSTSAAAQNNNNNNNNTNDTFKLNDANSRGWLESSGVQVNPSRSVEKKSHHRKQTKELSQKGFYI